MSESFLHHNPEDDGYIVQLNEYDHGETNFEAAMEDQEAAHNEIADHASEWYGTLWNAPSVSPPLWWTARYHNVHLASDPRPPGWDTPFSYGQSVPISPPPFSVQFADAHLAIGAPNFAIDPNLISPTDHSTVVAPVPYDLNGHPSVPEDLVRRLTAAGADTLADLARDTSNLLWIHMSLSSMGRVPADSLCETLYIKAIKRRHRAQVNWVPEQVTVMLSVPEPAQGSSARINFQEMPVVTELNNELFKDAISAQVKVASRMFREHAFNSANHLIRTLTTDSSPSIIPFLQDGVTVTPDFKNELKRSLEVGPYGPRIFHGKPQSNNLIDVDFFGNVLFCDLVQKAVYDAESRGWFGFLKDTDGPNGPIWTPLVSADCYTVAYVCAWIIEALTDFCNGVTPSLGDKKLQKVNSQVHDITDFFNTVLVGFPGIPLHAQNSMRISLLPLIR